MNYNEEVAANSVGTGSAVSLPPSVEPPGIPASKKRKRKKVNEINSSSSGFEKISTFASTRGVQPAQ